MLRPALLFTSLASLAFLVVSCDDVTPRPPMVDTPTVVSSVPSPTGCTDAQDALQLFKSAIWPTPGPAPQYPGATDIEYRTLDEVFMKEIKETTFKTTDEPDKVLGFYKDVLQRDNWHIVTESDFPKQEITFVWAGIEATRQAMPCPPTPEVGELMYLVTVTTQKIGDATEVEVREGYEQGR